MKKLFLHIGTGKTGTSSIQNFLYQHREVLSRQYGVLYPATGLVSSNHFGEMIHAHYPLVGWVVKREMNRLQKLREELKASSCETMIVSCENFYHQLAQADVAFLRDFFAEFDVRIVCYVRRQDKYMESAWKQQVKVGAMAAPFENFLLRHTDPKFLHEVHGNYHKMLQVWAGVFGKEHLVVRVFDPAVWPQRDLLNDFVKALALPSAIQEFQRDPIINIALPSELMRLLCRINRMKLVKGAQQQEDLVMWLRSMSTFNNPPMLSYQDRCDVLKNYEQSNYLLFNELCGVSVPRCFTSAVVPVPKQPEPPGPRKFLPVEDSAIKVLLAAWSQQKSEGLPSAKMPLSAPDVAKEEAKIVQALEQYFARKPVLAEETKPWPPLITEKLGFDVNTKPLDVVHLIKQSQAHKRPLSIIRLGDGESAVIGYPEFTPEKEFERFLGLFFGNNLLDAQQKEQLVALVRACVKEADVIGVVGGTAITKFTAVRHFLAHYQLAQPGGRMTLLSLHRNLQEKNLYQEILRGQDEIGIVTCRDVEAQLKQAFGISKIHSYKVPEEAGHAHKGARVERHFPDRFEQLRRSLQVPRPGMLFLVGAGPLGKVYCQWIKERGGIALDVGSMFDAWAGLSTRKFMRTEAGHLDEQYLLHQARPSASKPGL